MDNFEPRILAFCCNWCSYAGADLAGVSRFQYPANIRDIRVMCSARVDPELVFEGFAKKLDAVAILGCHPGDCHYIHGNYFTMRKAELIKQLIREVGLDERRFLLDWVSAAEGAKFASLVSEFTKTVAELGPLGVKENVTGEDLMSKIQAAKLAARQERVRWLVGKQYLLESAPNAFNEKFDDEKLKQIVRESATREYKRQRILLSLKEKPSSCIEVASKINIPSDEVLREMVVLRRKGLIDVSGVEDRNPIYITL
ncbi:MAG: hydrogenase iron-sulfur subunit [Planctomycetota bacterium]